MTWSIVILILILFGGLVYLFMRDRRREKSSVAQTMSPSMWDEIQREREESIAHAKKFKEALLKAKEREGPEQKA